MDIVEISGCVLSVFIPAYLRTGGECSLSIFAFIFLIYWCFYGAVDVVMVFLVQFFPVTSLSSWHFRLSFFVLVLY